MARLKSYQNSGGGFVSFPGVCAKGKGKLFFSTQDPLLEFFLERQFVKDRPSLPPWDLRGQCSLNLEEDKRAAVT